MQYSEFEKQLVDIFKVRKKDLRAFQARLRHLRNLGVPNVPKRGSGNTAVYKTIDVLTAFTALALQGLGSSPSISADVARSAVGAFSEMQRPGHADDVFLIVAYAPDYRGGVLDDKAEAEEEVPATMSGLPDNLRPLRAITNPLGRTVPYIFSGSPEEAWSWIAGFRSISVSLINLTERYKALPKDD